MGADGSVVAVPVSLHVGLDDVGRLIHDPLAVPDLVRDGDSGIVVEAYAGRHAVVGGTVVAGARDGLVVVDAADILALPGLPTVKGADYDHLRGGHSVD